MSEHLTTNTLSEYRQHRLSEDETARVDLHIMECEACASDVLEGYGVLIREGGAPAVEQPSLLGDPALAKLSRAARSTLAELLTSAPLRSVACEAGMRFDEWVRELHECASALRRDCPELVAGAERFRNVPRGLAESSADGVELAFDAARKSGSCILPGGLRCRLEMAYVGSALQLGLQRLGPEELLLLPILCHFRFRREDEDRHLAVAPQALGLAVYRAAWAGADERAWQDALASVIPARRCFVAVGEETRMLEGAPGLPVSALVRAERSVTIVNQVRPQLVAAAASSASRQPLRSSFVEEYKCHVWITRGGDRVYFRICSELVQFVGHTFALELGSFSVRLTMVLESDGRAWGYADADDSDGTLRAIASQEGKGLVQLELLARNGQG